MQEARRNVSRRQEDCRKEQPGDKTEGQLGLQQEPNAATMPELQ